MSQSFKNYEKCLAYPILNTYNPPHLRDTMSKTTKLKLFWNIKLKYIIQNHTSALLHNCKNGFWKGGSVLVDSCQEYMSPFTQNKFIFPEAWKSLSIWLYRSWEKCVKSQPVFTCSKLTIETQSRVWNMFKVK